MPLGRVVSCIGVVGMNPLVMQPAVAAWKTIFFFGVGFCIGMIRISHFILQPVVAVRLDYVPCYGGVLYWSVWNESVGTVAFCSCEARLHPLVGWALVSVFLE